MADEQPFILANLIRQWTEAAPERDVLTFVSIDSDGAFYEDIRTYQQLWENGQRLAAWLKQQGMRKGDRFALVMQNHAEFVDFMVASSIMGTVFVPIDSRTRGSKLKYMLEFAECKGAVVSDNALQEVRSVWSSASSDHWLLAVGKCQDQCVGTDAILVADIPDPLLEVASIDADEPMQLLYTSGTTGDPKAIMSSHSRYAVAASLPSLFGLDKDDRPYTGLSLTHANAQIITLGMCLITGMRGVVSLRFTKSRLWEITRRYGCTFFNVLGGMTNALYAELPQDDDANNPVCTILSAGMPATLWEDFSQRFDVELFEFYGAAEGGLAFNPPKIGPVGSCGKAPPSMQLAVLNEAGEHCAPGVAGEICFRQADGSCPSFAYFKNAEATLKKLAGGWLHMGDIGHLDENGWLFFHHRDGGGVRKNGDFINTSFVEKALLELDAVAEVYVYGLAVSTNLAPGEKDVVAAIVPTEPLSFDAVKVLRTCRGDLDRNSVPDFIQVLQDIPKTASEKPQDLLLAEAFSENPLDVFSLASLD